MKKLLFFLLVILALVSPCHAVMVIGSGTGGGDVTAPTLSTATIETDGTTWTFAFDENVQIGTTASTANIDYYSESNQSNQPVLYSGLQTAIGQSFTGNGNTLNIAKFYLKKFGSPTGNAYAKVYNETHATAFGTDSLPDGAAIATSDAFDVSTLTTSFQLISFTFSTPPTLTNASKYVLTIEYSGGDSNNFVRVGGDNTTPTHDGNYCIFAVGWSADSGADTIFYAITNTTVPDSTGWAVTMTTAGAITLTYDSGTGTSSLVYTGSPTVNSGDTVSSGLNYTQAGGKIRDTSNNDLASLTSHAVVNNSSQSSSFSCATSGDSIACDNFDGGAVTCVDDGSSQANCYTAWTVGNTGGTTTNQGTGLESGTNYGKTITSSSGNYRSSYKSFTAAGEVHTFTLVKIGTLSYTSETPYSLIGLTTDSPGNLCSLGFVYSAPDVLFTIYNGSTWTNSAVVPAANTLYYIWIDYVKNTATTGCKVTVGTTGTKSSGTVIQATSQNLDAGRLYLSTDNESGYVWSPVTFDRIRINSTAIGDYVP